MTNDRNNNAFFFIKANLKVFVYLVINLGCDSKFREIQRGHLYLLVILYPKAVGVLKTGG